MFFLPAALLLLAALQVTAIPIDKSSCTPAHLTLILGPTYANSPPIHHYCSHHLFTPSQAPHPSLPLEVSQSASAADVHAACECIVALPPLPVAPQFPSQKELGSGGFAGLGLKAVPQPYGRGALPAPLGSELKGFGARDNLYVRGGIVDGVNNRGA